MTPTHFPRRLRLLALAAAVSLSLSACKDESEAALLQSARQHAQKQEHKAALIQLRNAIQLYPQSGEVRMTLGELLLSNGEFVNAALEFDKAKDLQIPHDRVVPPLARALLGSGDAAQLLQRFEQAQLGTASARADLAASLAGAQLRLNRPEQADALLAKAYAEDPQSPPVLALMARRQAARGQIDAALLTVRKAQAVHPDKAMLATFEGDLLFSGKGDTAGADQAYQRALQSRPQYGPALVSRVAVAFTAQQPDMARERLEALNQVLPEHPQTLMLQGQFALLENRLADAERRSQQLLQLAPDEPRVQLLAGEVAARKGTLPQADAFLGRLIQRNPEAIAPRRILAQAHLQAGNAERALALLEPLLTRQKADAQSWALAAQASLTLGDTARAQHHLMQAARLSPEDMRLRTATALAKEGRSPQQTLTELQALAQQDKGSSADIALISALLTQRDYEGALTAVKNLQAKQPTSAVVAFVEGRIRMLQGQTAEARRAWERSLALDGQHFASAAALAALDARDGQTAAALQRLEAYTRLNHASEAHLAIADLKRRAGSTPAEVEAQLLKSIQSAPTEMAPRLALVHHRLGRSDGAGAVRAAQEATAALPDRLDVAELLAQVQSRTGAHQDATDTWRRISHREPKNPEWLLRLAGSLADQGEQSQARQALKRALELKPEFLPAQRALVALALMGGNTESALATVRQMQKQRPQQVLSWALEGDVHAHAQDWDAAAKAYRAAHKLQPTTESAIKLHTVLTAADRKDDARKFASDWERLHPRDVAFLVHQGDTASAARRWAVAERYLLRAEELQPDNAVVLNNLAYALAQQGKSGAVAKAQKANQLAPEQPALLDTLATALASERQLPQALEIQRKAVQTAGERQPDLRMRLAELYLQAGDRNNARQELTQLSQLGERYAGHQQVRELLRTI